MAASPPFLLVPAPHENFIWIRMAPELNQDVWRGQKKFQMTSFTKPNNISSMKCALKSVPGLTDVGVPQGDGDGPRALAPRSGSKKHMHHVHQHEKLERLNTYLLA